jgi:hypothetical protein
VISKNLYDFQTIKETLQDKKNRFKIKNGLDKTNLKETQNMVIW